MCKTLNVSYKKKGREYSKIAWLSGICTSSIPRCILVCAVASGCHKSQLCLNFSLLSKISLEFVFLIDFWKMEWLNRKDVIVYSAFLRFVLWDKCCVIWCFSSCKFVTRSSVCQNLLIKKKASKGENWKLRSWTMILVQLDYPFQ